MTNEERFWNDPLIVKEFAEYPVPPYWAEYFSRQPKNLKILDLGCGGGRNTSYLIQEGFDVWACDVHAGMVEETCARVGSFLETDKANQRVFQSNMTDLPFDADTFDCVLANGVYHNVSSLKEFTQAIRETSRVLKPDGILCVNVFCDEHVAADLTPYGNEIHMYQTAQHLPMALLPAELILEQLATFNLTPTTAVARYESPVNTGVRSVLRGTFMKSR
ncbi:MAG TPA: class I SAM-dependent methyltransferase [Patescibacteria group bacterium]